MSEKTNQAIVGLRTAHSIALRELMGAGTLPDTTRQLTKMAEGLAELRSNPDPSQTTEWNAAKYRREYEKQTERALALIEQEKERLEIQVNRRRDEAAQTAKYDKPINQSEIRAALLRLDPKKRDKALTDAAREGRGDILAAIESEPAFLWGGSSHAVGDLVETALTSVSPEYKEARNLHERGIRTLAEAGRYYGEAAESLRDPIGESRASEASRKHAAAQEKLA